jgi:SAM-dependent methyltransferase
MTLSDTGAAPFYGPEQAGIHHEAFGRLAERAANHLLTELTAAGLTEGTVVDLGCGSGILAHIVSEAGYDVLGADISASMVALAKANAPRARIIRSSLYDVEIPPAVAVMATGEALNYATDPRAGPATFEGFVAGVHAALVPGGIFAFDVSIHGRSGPTGLRQQFHGRDGWSVGVREVEEGDRLTSDIATFTREADGRYRRTDERHVLHVFDREALVTTLTDAGFEVATAIDYGPPQFEPLEGWVVVSARRR